MLNSNLSVDKTFQRGPDVSEIFAPGVQKFQHKLSGDPDISIPYSKKTSRIKTFVVFGDFL